MSWVKAQQLSQQGSHFVVGETPELEAEQHQHAEQGLHTCAVETESGRSLPIGFNRPHHLLKRVFANRAIMRYGLDAQKTPIGLEAYLPQFRQLFNSLPMPKSRVLLMVVSVRSALPCGTA
ncbi:MAG: hypothetical protein JNL98_09695 [Bryobacterales bacterium]|nr:hypothetical protein [Bryobacterales bacterium]